MDLFPTLQAKLDRRTTVSPGWSDWHQILRRVELPSEALGEKDPGSTEAARACDQSVPPRSLPEKGDTRPIGSQSRQVAGAANCPGGAAIQAGAA